MKLQCTGSLDFIFYGIELNPALQISDQSSKVKVSRTEISCIFCTHFRPHLMNTLLCLSIILQTRDMVEWVYSIKNSLPVVIRNDLSFEESIVAELKFGRKKIFFTILYRSPASFSSLLNRF